MGTPSISPKFVVDVNVGRLAKWLRIMGYDTLFPTHAEDNELVRIAIQGGRIIVTRDAGLAVRHAVTTGRLKVVLIKADDLKNQLLQVIATLQLEAAYQFSRCIRCNQPLEGITRDLAVDKVPPYVFNTQTEFMIFPLCQKVFWRGTHWTNMQMELAELQVGNYE